MENRCIAANHPQEALTKMRSKKVLKGEKPWFYRNKTTVNEILTGQ